MGAGVGKSSGFDASQNATTASINNGSGAQLAPKDKNLEILGELLKKVGLIVIGEVYEEDIPTMEDIN